jgi:hypothetical protein
LVRDFGFAVRQLLKTPAWAAVVVSTLALGIGANTAVFSLVNDVLLRSLPVRAPGDLVLFRTIDGPGGRPSRAGENNGSIDPVTGRNASTSFALLTFERFRDHHPALSDVFAYAPFNQISLVIDGEPETLPLGQLVSGDYYGALGVSATLGRTMTPADDQPSAPPVAVISHRYWENRFGSDPKVLGRIIQINKVSVALIGVTPPGFAGAMQARASLEPIFQQAAREGWRDMPSLPTLAADPGGQGENDRRRQYAQSLRVLMGLVGLVLLAACANVANLLLARGGSRRKEIAVRLALGAERVHIIRQLLAESVVLASLGAALGVLVAYASRGLLVALRQFGGAPAVLALPLDLRVLGFTIAVATGTALLCGLAPAIRATRVDLTTEFKEAPVCSAAADAHASPAASWSSRLRCRSCCWSAPASSSARCAICAASIPASIRRTSSSFASTPRPRATRRHGSRLCTRACRSGSHAFRASAPRPSRGSPCSRAAAPIAGSRWPAQRPGRAARRLSTSTAWRRTSSA